MLLSAAAIDCGPQSPPPPQSATRSLGSFAENFFHEAYPDDIPHLPLFQLHSLLPFALFAGLAEDILVRVLAGLNFGWRNPYNRNCRTWH
jgi:hypothetical protein